MGVGIGIELLVCSHRFCGAAGLDFHRAAAINLGHFDDVDKGQG